MELIGTYKLQSYMREATQALSDLLDTVRDGRQLSSGARGTLLYMINYFYGTISNSTTKELFCTTYTNPKLFSYQVFND